MAFLKAKSSLLLAFYSAPPHYSSSSSISVCLASGGVMELYLLVLVLVINLLAVTAVLAILHLLLKEISWMDLLLLLCSVSTYIWAGIAVFLVLTPPPPIEDPPSKERGVWAIYVTTTVVILVMCVGGVAMDWSYRPAGGWGSQTRPGCRVWDWGCPPVINSRHNFR